MATEPETIHVPDDSDLAHFLERNKGEPRRLESNGVIYRVVRENEDVWATYDPEAVRAGMRAAAGHLTADEAEELKNCIYRDREDGTRPPSYP